MWKKILLSAVALGFAITANMQLCCSMWVQGQRLDGLFDPRAVDQGMTAANAAEEEIIANAAKMPEVRLRYGLSFRPLQDSSAAVSSALLDCTEGVVLNQGVYVNNVYLGSVADREVLFRAVSSFITNQLPSWADYGFLSQELVTKHQYSRVGNETAIADMVLLIAGMAPVMYADNQGHVAMA